MWLVRIKVKTETNNQPFHITQHRNIIVTDIAMETVLFFHLPQVSGIHQLADGIFSHSKWDFSHKKLKIK